MKLDKGTPSNLIKDIMKNISTKNDAFVHLVTIILLILLTIDANNCIKWKGINSEIGLQCDILKMGCEQQIRFRRGQQHSKCENPLPITNHFTAAVSYSGQYGDGSKGKDVIIGAVQKLSDYSTFLRVPQVDITLLSGV